MYDMNRTWHYQRVLMLYIILVHLTLPQKCPLDFEMTFLHDTPFLTPHHSSIPDVSDESGILYALFQEGSGILHTCPVDTTHRRTFLYVTLSDHTRQALSVKRK